MKKTVLAIFYICLISFGSCKGDKENNSNHNKEIDSLVKKESTIVKKINIQYEDMFTTSTLRVSCVQFEEKFKLVLKEKTINDLTEISKFQNFINETVLNNFVKDNIDVRVKINIIYDSKTKKEICLGLHRMQINGVIYSITDEFREYLMEITETTKSVQE